MTRLIFALVAIGTVITTKPVHADDIHEFVLSGKFDKVKELLAKNPTLKESRNNQDRTPLILALRNDHTEIAKYLIELGADINATGFDGNHPLFLTEDPEIVKLILARKPTLEIQSNNQTPLQRAAYNCRDRGFDPMNKWRTIAKMLIDAGANYDLGSAINLDDPVRVKAIFKENPKQALDSEVFQDAIQVGRTAIVELFLEYKANPHYRDNDGFSVLYYASKHASVVRVLLKAGADPNIRIEYRKPGTFGKPEEITLLHWVAQEGYLDTAKVLIEAGVDVDSRADDGDTPLVWAAHMRHAEMVKLLLKHKAETRDSDGRTAMAAATAPIAFLKRSPAELDRSKLVVGLLRDAGVPVEISTEVALGNAERVRQMLKEKPALASAKDVHGEPVLSRAVGLADKQLAVMLLDAGAAIEGVDGEWVTALHTAASAGHTEITRLLVDRGAKLNVRTKTGTTPLHQAARNNNLDSVRILLDAGADINAEDNAGRTPLATAYQIKMIEYLKKRGAK